MIKITRFITLLLTLVCMGCYSKVTDFIPESNYQCMDDIIDAKVAFLEQTQGKRFGMDVGLPIVSFLKFNFGGNRTTGLKLQMTIRNGYEGVKWTAFGQGKVKNLNWSMQGNVQVNIPKVNIPIGGPIGGYTHISSQSNLLSKLVEESVKDGFEQLAKARDRHIPWHIAIRNISSDGKILIPLGSSNGFRKEDIFPIYSKTSFNNHSCHNIANNEPATLAIAKIVDLNNERSILEIIVQSDDPNRRVEEGDIIKAFRKNDENKNRSQAKKLLKLGIIHADIDVEIGGQLHRQNINPLVKEHIFRQAHNFDFKIIIPD